MKDRRIIKLSPPPKYEISEYVPIRKKRVAAYARVSTDNPEQQTSFAAQVDYYTELIAQNPEWDFVKVYADDGISGCRTDKRYGFLQMMQDCENGLIDLILTKSVSRFARNTVDSISAIRRLKEMNIGVYFEKENILSLDSKGEFLLTLMSSLAQEESRSISENVRWSVRKRFADGKSSLPYSRFLGYDKGKEKYTMTVNEEQAVIVRRIFRLFLQGYTNHSIAKMVTKEGIPTPSGFKNWSQSTIGSILGNEKYKGDALLQKCFTIDFLSKKKKKNRGELPQYYVTSDHEAIISPWLFDYVQQQRMLKTSRTLSRYSGHALYCSKIICGKCGEKYGMRPWHSTSYNDFVWQCRNRYNQAVKCKTVNIYDMYLHYITHTMAVNKIKRLPEVKKDLVECLKAVIDENRIKSIQRAINRCLRSNVWNLWADEDDLVLIIDRLITQENGTLTVHWIDGSEDVFQMERFSPRMFLDKTDIYQLK